MGHYPIHDAFGSAYRANSVTPSNSKGSGFRKGRVGISDQSNKSGARDLASTNDSGASLDAAALRSLRNSERSYRRLFESAQDGILILDAASGRITDANPFLLELVDFSFEEVIGKTVGELSPFKDIMPNQLMLERLQEEGYVRYDDLPLETRDGRKIAVEFVSNVYEAGDQLVIQCNIRDITERKRSEQHLALLTACVTNLNDVFMVTEADPVAEPGPKIVFVNESFERNTGYAANETLGRNPRFLQGPKTDRRVLAEIHAALGRFQPIRRQVINYRKDGTEYWVDLDIVPILGSDGKCTHFAAIERDITEAEKKEARFRRLVDSNVQSVVFWNTWGAVTDANDAFLKLTRFTRDDVNSGAVNWSALTPPECIPLDQRAVKEMAALGACEPYEKELIRKDGTKVAIWIGSTVFEDNPDEGVSFILDLTERKKLERQFLRAQRMESIGTLAGGIAHDLNNILTPIMMSIGLLREFVVEPEGTHLLDIIGMSAKRGADIVGQVLTFARGVDGERREVQVKILLHELESMIKETFPRDVRWELLVPADTWMILGDSTQLHQVFMNLCVNARDAMPSGGSLSIRVENVLLDEQYTAMNLQLKAGRYLKICVADTGTGIPAEIHDKIFDPFFTTKEVNRGTGLGLSTVQGIVKGHGGAINVYSEVGLGTTFTVYLPAMTTAKVERELPPNFPGLLRGRGETILLVDDEAAILTITGQTLLAFGYRVLTAEDGAQALAIYAEHRKEIALVLTDMMMPVMAGPATIHALRRMNPAVRIIAISGLNANDGMSLRAQVGNDFLMKPYSADTLLKAVRAKLDEV
jgi:two-component system cell cycle sensor histidine kinase/response regulator CckA